MAGARLLADEHFRVQIVFRLRRLGDDVELVRDLCLKKSGDSFPDDLILDYAIQNDRVVLTENVAHFRELHKRVPWHMGIIACSINRSDEPKSTARRIHDVLREHESSIKGKFVRLLRDGSCVLGPDEPVP
jgi:hypothetical protein